MTLQPQTRVWRYMSFAQFASLLQRKKLWLSNAKLFSDKWEGTLHVPQLNTLINMRPPSVSAEAARQEVSSAVEALRKQTFVSCWTASEHESHALWRIYCRTNEGVAIQTMSFFRIIPPPFS